MQDATKSQEVSHWTKGGGMFCHALSQGIHADRSKIEATQRMSPQQTSQLWRTFSIKYDILKDLSIC